MTTKKKRRSYYKIITDAQLALRELRLEKGWSLAEAALPLGIKSKALGHIENGRVSLTDERVKQILEVWGLHYHDFIRAKKMMKDERRNRPKRKIIRTVLSNNDRRSYQRIITKEVRILKILRKMKKLTQDKASSICGYSRPTIGHIENGRIEILKERIEHIVMAYGFEMKEFNEMLASDVLRDEVSGKCMDKINKLSVEKLKIIQNLLESM